MTIYESAYSTLIGKNIINVPKTKKEVEKHLITDDLILVNHAGLQSDFAIIPVGLMGNCPAALSIPFFVNPLQVTLNHKNYILMDFRPFTVPTGKGCLYTDVRVRSNTEFELAKDRLIFSLDWALKVQNPRGIKEPVTSIKTNFKFASFVFSKWISKLLTQRFNLYPDESLTVEIISNYYYQMLFEENDTIDHTTMEKFLIHTIKNTGAKADSIEKIFKQIGPMSGVNDLCVNIARILENVKLEDLNSGLLITIVGNSWFGINSKELLGIALEYPPSFIPLVYNALKEKTYKHTYLATVANAYAKNKGVNEFLSNYKAFIDSYTDQKSTISL